MKMFLQIKQCGEILSFHFPSMLKEKRGGKGRGLRGGDRREEGKT
jgi:hypothetical protein